MTDSSKQAVSRGLKTFLILAGVNAIWGSTDSAAKYAVGELSPAALAWARFTVALIAFTPALISRRNEIPRSLKGLLPFMALGACGFFLNFYLYYFGLKLSLASHATALRVSEALVILTLSWLILREKIGGRALLGIIIGTVGVVMVLDIDFNNLGLFSGGYLAGDLLIFSGIAVEGLYTVIGKGVLKRTRPLTATALACLFGWIGLTVFSAPDVAALVRDPPSISAILAVLYLGLVATGFCYLVWYVVLAGEESHRVGITIMVQPAVGIPMAAIFLDEKIGWVFLAGSVLIAAGVYTALSGRHPEEPEASSVSRA